MLMQQQHQRSVEKTGSFSSNNNNNGTHFSSDGEEKFDSLMIDEEQPLEICEQQDLSKGQKAATGEYILIYSHIVIV